MEIVIFARFHARQGCENDVRRVIEAVLPHTRKEPGCLGARLFQSIKDARLLFIHSHWRDEAAFDAHGAMPYTIEFVDAVVPLIDHEMDVARTAAIS